MHETATPHIANLQSGGQPRLVSVIAPCRNEAAHIDAFCDGALAQRLPDGWQMELLVADGMSDDGTRERLHARAAQDARLQAIDNAGRIVSTGLNACLARARGEVIVRLDIHTRFAPDYVAECLHALRRTGADNVGGPWLACGEGAMGRAIAAAFQCRWVVGGARSRDVRHEGEVDSVYLGCWPRRVLARAGGFDETLVRNQDDEHNLRLRRLGLRVWQSARIRSAYRPRASLRLLFAQQFQYGYWRPFVMRKHGQAGSLRQLAPMLFVAALFAAALLALAAAALPGLALPAPWLAAPRRALAALLLAYGAYLAVASAAAVRQARGAQSAQPAHWLQGQRQPAGRLALLGLWVRLPAVVAAYHIGYGLGTWRGLWDVLRGRRHHATAAALTR